MRPRSTTAHTCRTLRMSSSGFRSSRTKSALFPGSIEPQSIAEPEVLGGVAGRSLQRGQWRQASPYHELQLVVHTEAGHSPIAAGKDRDAGLLHIRDGAARRIRGGGG